MKKKIKLAISFGIITAIIITISIFVIINQVKIEGEYGRKYINPNFDYEITKPSEEWNTVNDYLKNVKENAIPFIPQQNYVHNIVFHKKSGEMIFIGVISDIPNMHDKRSLSGAIVSSFPNIWKEFQYSEDPWYAENEILIKLPLNNPDVQVELRIITHNDMVYLNQKTYNPKTAFKDSLSELDKIWNSLEFCSTQIFGCLK